MIDKHSAIFVQGSEEWLAQRRKMIGASDAPVIMGVSPWCTPYRLWQEKLEIVKPRKQTKAMAMGIRREDTARSRFTEETGISVKPAVIFHKDIPEMTDSIIVIDFAAPFRQVDC